MRGVGLLTAVLLVLSSSGAVAADPLYGNDVSWPQCSKAQGGYDLPMPAKDADFMIIGLSQGLAFTENPCLASQARYARDRGLPAHAYAMATFPTAAQLATHGARGPFAATTRAGQLRNTGYAEGRYAMASLTRVGWSPPMIWVDVEPRAAQPWPTGTTQAQTENRWVIEGLLRSLHDAGVGYGLYSYAHGWQEITGGWSLPGVPVWATAGKLDYPDEAKDRCTQPSFSGGEVHLSQWWLDNTVDHNLTCGSYRFTPAPLRVSGADRVATSVAVSRQAYPDGAPVAFVATGVTFADALSGGPAAARAGGPILLTDSGALPDMVITELSRLSPTKVYVLGGSTAVADSILARIAAQWPVERVAGADRYATAAAVTQRFWGTSSTVFVAAGSGFPDALAGGAAAARSAAPIVLTNRDALPRPSSARLQALAPTRVVVLGGPTAVSEKVVSQIRTTVPKATIERIGGRDRYATARDVVLRFWPNGSTQAFVATGTTFPDALSAAPLAARNGAPVILSKPTCAPRETRAALTATGAHLRTLIGGQQALATFSLDVGCP